MKPKPHKTTPATRFLRERGVEFSEHRYDYGARSGALGAAAALGLDPHQVVKTLVMRASDGETLLVLMHGDREVSTKGLARDLGVQWIKPMEPQDAQRRTGYLVGGISPFGIKEPLRTCVPASIRELPEVYVNGGSRGLLVGLSPGDLLELLQVKTATASGDFLI